MQPRKKVKGDTGQTLQKFLEQIITSLHAPNKLVLFYALHTDQLFGQGTGLLNSVN